MEFNYKIITLTFIYFIFFVTVILRKKIVARKIISSIIYILTLLSFFIIISYSRNGFDILNIANNSHEQITSFTQLLTVFLSSGIALISVMLIVETLRLQRKDIDMFASTKFDTSNIEICAKIEVQIDEILLKSIYHKNDDDLEMRTIEACMSYHNDSKYSSFLNILYLNKKCDIACVDLISDYISISTLLSSICLSIKNLSIDIKFVYISYYMNKYAFLSDKLYNNNDYYFANSFEEYIKKSTGKKLQNILFNKKNIEDFFNDEYLI